MKNTLLLIILFCVSFCKSQNIRHDKEVNVLFIGNSLTYFHDMPKMLQAMLSENDQNFKIYQSTFPGMSLSDHLDEIIVARTENMVNTRKKTDSETTETEKMIAERNWDVIIMQTGTVSVLIPEYRDQDIDHSIKTIKKLVSNPDCKFILFTTWAGKENYPQKYCYPSKIIFDPKICSPVIKDLVQHQELISEGHSLLASKNDLIQSKNSEKFYEVMTKHPDIELLEDEIHPNKTGSFFNACIFYSLLTDKDASQLKYLGEIKPETANTLKRMAK
ncbi:DUF4886 domain-containing protein [Chryseobacterium sp.]|uniref:DUF4886 domain-containing protein n=1 Tax=Chryseobacterium sp. TaxID=1871047 RepID=UPI000EDEB444|nr:DUF4886 domain-containing protein [Chryseobacterium sp.]HCA08815.1 DUF4886 domain-containing protein [Chryseobacterium sp.]